MHAGKSMLVCVPVSNRVPVPQGTAYSNPMIILSYILETYNPFFHQERHNVPVSLPESTFSLELWLSLSTIPSSEDLGELTGALSPSVGCRDPQSRMMKGSRVCLLLKHEWKRHEEATRLSKVRVRGHPDHHTLLFPHLSSPQAAAVIVS